MQLNQMQLQSKLLSCEFISFSLPCWCHQKEWKSSQSSVDVTAPGIYHFWDFWVFCDHFEACLNWFYVDWVKIWNSSTQLVRLTVPADDIAKQKMRFYIQGEWGRIRRNCCALFGASIRFGPPTSWSHTLSQQTDCLHILSKAFAWLNQTPFILLHVCIFCVYELKYVNFVPDGEVRFEVGHNDLWGQLVEVVLWTSMCWYIKYICIFIWLVFLKRDNRYGQSISNGGK